MSYNPPVLIAWRTADLVRKAFLPRNPNKLRSACPEVVNAAHDFIHTAQAEHELIRQLRAWRASEVNHGAIVLGLRAGDETAAKESSDRELHELRKIADDVLGHATLLKGEPTP